MRVGEVATDEFVRDHPELHHYTSLEGFMGIASSNTLWATHFEDLNDTTEFVYLRSPLVNELEVRFRRALISWRKNSLMRSRQIANVGSIPRVAHDLASELVDALYSTAFGGASEPPLAVPYITSFCSHVRDMDYERHNGLLSQWRGYGANGGVCIVFDTAPLVDLLREAYPKAYWVHMQLAAAEYALDQRTIDQLFPELVASCERTVVNFFEGDGFRDLPESLFSDLVDGASRFKHRGFFEEREVRLVAIPAPAATLEKMKELHPEFEAGPLVPTRERNGSIGRARYIVLLDPPSRPLPIKRVIIGPSKFQNDLETAVRDGLLGDVQIHRSETPLI